VVVLAEMVMSQGQMVALAAGAGLLALQERQEGLATLQALRHRRVTTAALRLWRLLPMVAGVVVVLAPWDQMDRVLAVGMAAMELHQQYLAVQLLTQAVVVELEIMQVEVL
jgi:hypothetical protein